MSRPHTLKSYGQLLALVLGALIVGKLLNQPLLVLSLCLLTALVFELRQRERLDNWLSADPRSSPPAGSGPWRALFHQLHRRQKRTQNRESQLLEQLQQFRDSANALPDALVAIDGAGRLEWSNPAAERYLGLNSIRDRGIQIANLLRIPAFRRYFRAGDFSHNLPINSPLDPALRLELIIVHYGDGAYLLMAHDVSRIHQLEQTREDFVANVSHELRTPLTVVSGYIENLLDYPERVPEGWLPPLENISQQAGRMRSIVEDLLMISHLENETAPDNQQPVVVEQLIQEICREAHTLSGDKNHQIQLDVDPTLGLLGNRQELYSAFSNLLFNAVRYTPANGEIQIRWYADDHGAHFACTDSGIGIARRHQARVTERFFRVDINRSRNTGGTGLGLAIVKHVLNRHNGTLEINSQLQRGSTFSCHFPPAQAVTLKQTTEKPESA